MAATHTKPTSATSLSWCERNQKEVAYATIIVGLALAMISLGMLATGSAVPLGPNAPDQYWTLPDASHYSDVVNHMEAGIGSILLFLPIALGLGAMLSGGKMLYENAKKEKNASGPTATYGIDKVRQSDPTQAAQEAQRQMRKNITLVVGFAVAMLGVGMIIGSSILMNHVVPDVKSLVDQATREHWSHPEFWQSVKTDWLDPVEWRLPLMATLGTFTVIGGGGIVASACGYSLCGKCKDALCAPSIEKEKEFDEGD